MKAMLTSLAALDGGQALAAVSSGMLTLYAEYLTMALRHAWDWAEWPELGRVRERTPVDGLVAWAESGQPLMGTVLGVTLDNPDTTVNPRPVRWRHDQGGLGVRVFQTSGSVFVRCTRTSPVVASAAWSNATAYAVDEVVYDATTGQCYEAVQAGTNHAVTDAAYWRVVELPWIFRTAVPRGALALKTGSGGQHETETLLQRSMDGLLRDEVEQFRSRAGQHQTLSVVNT